MFVLKRFRVANRKR